jgi:peptide/nickel transport system permease protein
MALYRAVLRRLVFSIAVVYLVITVLFAVIVVTPDTNMRGMLGAAAFAGANETELQQMAQTYLEARGRDKPLHARYIGWLIDITLLQWGYSVSAQKPVATAVIDSTVRTSLYLVPAFVLSVAGGVLSGLVSAWRRGRVSDRVARIVVYALFGLPSFFVGIVLVSALGIDGGTLTIAVSESGITEGTPDAFVGKYILPIVVLLLSLLAGQVSYTRALSLEYVNAPFVRVLQGKGLSTVQILRRIVRNAAVPIASLIVTELLAVLVLNIFVIEFFFGIPGLGFLTRLAVDERDIPLLMGTTLVVVIAGVGGSFLQDVASDYLDPRTRDE